MKTTSELLWQVGERRFLAAISSHLRNRFAIRKIIINKSNAYLNDEDLRLKCGMVEVYDGGVQGLITNESWRNQELINAW
ncbi:hypothetical protein [Mesorhizobium hawassense]|uniref:hypothetical protein n=1 Tax=Mesorhizobium hawassense TaxID=1209954 RepID=UPI0011BE19D1|nr:hypothetical protein [Mesorhizobium hawassense]